MCVKCEPVKMAYIQINLILTSENLCPSSTVCNTECTPRVFLTNLIGQLQNNAELFVYRWLDSVRL